jgi:hemoglobin
MMKNPLSLAVFFACTMLAFAPRAFAQDPLFADMGGKAGIDHLVDVFVGNYLADPRIRAIFDESNMDRVRAKMKEQFCVVAGGPCTYTGHSMEATHKGLHLTDADFNAVVEDLQDAMDTCNIPFSVQNRFLARMAPMQHQVVTK